MNNIDILHIDINTKEFYFALILCNSITSKNKYNPQTNNIHINTNNNHIEIHATNLDIYLIKTIPAKANTKKNIVLPINVLINIIKKITDIQIKILQNNNNTIEIHGKHCQFILFTLDNSFFPYLQLQQLNKKNSIQITAKNLFSILHYTVFSASDNNINSNINGVHLHNNQEKIYSISTDGHRLSITSCNLINYNTTFKFTIPKNTVQELLKFIKNIQIFNEVINININDRFIEFNSHNYTLTSKLTNPNFPNYLSLIPKNNTSILTINRKTFINILDRVSVITSDDFKIIQMKINKHELEFSSYHNTKGVAKETIKYTDKVYTFTGIYNNINFNPKYMNDILNILITHQIKISFNNIDDPILIEPISNKESKFVIMPIKII